MKKYVCGFMFSDDLKAVALIRKEKPSWQKGKLNGIGGKIEPGEDSATAMRREFIEEAGVLSDWQFYLKVQSHINKSEDDEAGFDIDFYTTVGALGMLVSRTEEMIEIHTLDSLPRRIDLIENIIWTVPMAAEYLRTGVTAIATYP